MRVMDDLEQLENEMPLYVPPPAPRKPIIKREIDVSTRVRRKLNFDYYENTEVEIKSRKRLRRTYEKKLGRFQPLAFSRIGEIPIHDKGNFQSSSMGEIFLRNQELTQSNAQISGGKILHNQGLNPFSSSNPGEICLNNQGNVEFSNIKTPVKSDRNTINNSEILQYSTSTVSPSVINRKSDISFFIPGDNNEENSEVLTVEESTYITPEKTVKENISEEADVSVLNESATSDLDTSFSSLTSSEYSFSSDV